MCRFRKSLTYCSLEGLCVWKYLAGSRRTKERYLAEIKRDRKAQCNWNAFNSFKLFPFQSTRAKVKREERNTFEPPSFFCWQSGCIPAEDWLPWPLSSAAHPRGPEDQQEEEERRSRIGRDIYLSKDFMTEIGEKSAKKSAQIKKRTSRRRSRGGAE